MNARHRPTGPKNPHLFQETAGKNKPAFVTVTRTGSIRVMYQGLDGSRWVDFRGELDSVGASSELLTHAALCDDKGKLVVQYASSTPVTNSLDDSLLVATHSTSRQLRLYRVKIAWAKQAFVVEHIKTLNNFFPFLPTGDAHAVGASALLPFVQLSYFEIISPSPGERARDTVRPFLILVYNYVPNQLQESQLQNGSSSLLVKLELDSAASTLHPSFDQLGTKKLNGSSAKEFLVWHASPMLLKS